MLIEGKNLFPLENIGYYTGYYMDSDGGVWSSKKGTKLVKLGGAQPSRYNGHTRYYTLNGRAVSEPFLKHAAQAHAGFKENTKRVPSDVQFGKTDVLTARSIGVDLTKVAASLSPPDRVHATSLEQGIRGRGFIVARVQNDRLVFSNVPAIHLTPESVRNEMTRLAHEHPGMKFVSLQVTGAVIANAVTWE